MPRGVDPSSFCSSVFAFDLSSGATSAASPLLAAMWRGVSRFLSCWLRLTPITLRQPNAVSSTSARPSVDAACSKQPPSEVDILDFAWLRSSSPTTDGPPLNRATSRADSPRLFIASTDALYSSSRDIFWMVRSDLRGSCNAPA